MDMASQLKSYSDDLATAVRDLSTYVRSSDEQPNLAQQSLAVGSGVHQEVQRAKASILSSTAKIRALVCGPADLLKHLASQCEIIACLRWLGEFQILACIPLSGSVSVKDMADLSGVPQWQLARIIRLTATIGFLHESQPGHVCHTPLSAAFVSDPSFLDAAMFLAESVAPAALQMAAATQRTQVSHRPNGSAYNLAFNTMKPFQVAREERPRLSRQWAAYLQHAGGLYAADNVIEILPWLNCSSNEIESVRVVEINAPSTAIARSLVEAHPTIHCVVQVTNMKTGSPDRIPPDAAATTCKTTDKPALAREPRDAGLSPRITVANRALGTRQTVTDAAVYIVHPPPVLGPPALEVILAELQVHFGVLRANGSVMLILTDRLLPEPGSVQDPEIEAVARARDLTMLQLANKGETELEELIALVDSVKDDVGGLVVANKLRVRGEVIVAIPVKYQAHADASGEMGLLATISEHAQTKCDAPNASHVAERLLDDTFDPDTEDLREGFGNFFSDDRLAQLPGLRNVEVEIPEAYYENRYLSYTFQRLHLPTEKKKEKEMPSVLIFGGSGKVAKSITAGLVKKGYQVFSVIRREEHVPSLRELGAIPIVQSLETASVAELASTIRTHAPDAVIFAAGAGQRTSADPNLSLVVDRDGAIRVFDAMAEAGATRRLLLLSAIDSRNRDKAAPGWYSEADRQASEQLWEVLPVYMKGKFEADKDLVEGNQRRGLQFTIIRPTWYGEEGRTGKVRAGLVNFEPKVSREDVADVFVACVENPATAGCVFEVSGGDVAIEDAVRKVAEEKIDSFGEMFR